MFLPSDVLPSPYPAIYLSIKLISPLFQWDCMCVILCTYIIVIKFPPLIIYFQESSLPKDLSAMAQLCSNALSNPNTRPVIVIVDAINQVGT